jgi:site-specific recombinase XerC
MSSILVPSTSLPSLVVTAGEQASIRFLEFLASAIRNPHTRRAHARAAEDFLSWCAGAGVTAITAVQPLHVASWIELQTQIHSAPTVKQRLAAIRHLFDWLVIGQIVPHNPAASVCGPSYTVKKGKTPVLDATEARQLLDSIDVTTPIGLRDRTLIALMVFSFARVGAALAMRVEDVYVQQRRRWVRLREKNGKRHEMPCNHTLEAYLHEYLEQTGLRDEPKGPLFRTIARAQHDSLAPGERVCNGAPARACRGHRYGDRQSHVPRDWHHCLPEKRRHARECRDYGQSRVHAHHAAIRPAPGRRQS